MIFFFFFFNDTATTEIYTLSLHDALPILNNSHTIWKFSAKAVRGLLIVFEKVLYTDSGNCASDEKLVR